MTRFDGLFHPRGVAIIGASCDLSRGGGQPLKALRGLGYTGAIHPVNPKHASIGGVRCYPAVGAIEGPLRSRRNLPRPFLAELRGAAILCGARGGPPRDIDALAATVSHILQMGWTLREKLLELDINPPFVRDAGKGAVAGDALAVLAEMPA